MSNLLKAFEWFSHIESGPQGRKDNCKGYKKPARRYPSL